ncbi:MAG: Rieske 2Fe-2S domain-containing protein [Cohaesibacter sp.]|nr:Rieske 2Fe-2S domain-containing protein [Cohaesibacter sp.]
MTDQTIFLCKKSDLAPTGAFGVTITTDQGNLDIVVVSMDHDPSSPQSKTPSKTGYKAYINSCPHLSMPMETFEHEFLDRENPALIVCSTHGARFRSNDGLCLSGPCDGASLTSIPLTYTEDAIFMEKPHKTR